MEIDPYFQDAVGAEVVVFVSHQVVGVGSVIVADLGAEGPDSINFV